MVNRGVADQKQVHLSLEYPKDAVPIGKTAEALDKPQSQTRLN
jgi:hypothetical protein